MPYLFDAIVIFAYFALILGIGLSQRSKSGSMEGFALGDRQIAWWAVLASILAAEISAGTVIISGQVEGLIRATNVVELHKHAKVKGTIESPNVTMEREVTFDGTMKMDALSNKAAPPAPAAKS